MLKSTGIYSLAVIAERAASFLMLPVYTHFLTPADYGTLELLNLTASLVGMLLGVRMGQAVFFYYFAETSRESRDEYISTAFLGSVLAACILSGCALLLAPAASRAIFGSSAFAFQFKLMFFSLAASLPMEIGLCYIRVRGRPDAFVRLSVTKLVLAMALNAALLAGFHLGLAAMLWSSAVVTSLASLYLAWYCLRETGLTIRWRKLAELIRYSAPLGISALAMFVIHFFDRFFLQRTVSLSQIGIYALAYQIAWIIAFAQTPFINYWGSQALGILSSADGERTYARVCTYLTAVLMGIAVLVSAFVRPVLEVMVSPSFRVCAVYVPVLALAYVLRTLGDYTRYVLVLEKRTGWDAAISAGGAVVVLAGYALLIPRYTLWGAILATASAFLFLFICGLWKAQQVRYLRYEFSRLGQIAVCGGIPILLACSFRPAGLPAQLALGLAVTGAFPLLLWASGFLRTEEKRHVLLAWERLTLCFAPR